MIGSISTILTHLNSCKRVLVTTHIRPDGDALGSAAAMVLAMRSRGIGAEVLLLSHLPNKYAFIFHENAIVYHDAEAGWPPTLDLRHFDALLCVDTGTWSQLPGLREKLAGWDKPKLVIDHHQTQEDWATAKYVDVQAAAAGEIIVQVIEQWGVKIDPAMASALYLAIVSDTGWFHFPNTSPTTLRTAAKLVDVGVDTDRLYQRLYQSESAKRFALHTRAMSSLQLLADAKLATMKLTASDFAQTGADVPDTENIINAPLAIGTVQVSVLLTEPPGGGAVRVSLRSKGGVDVARFAEMFGGGGHARAAGLRIEASLTQADRQVTEAMVARLSEGSKDSSALRA